MMEKDNKGQVGNESKKESQEESPDYKIAQNPNPRANENIKEAPFEKTQPDSTAVGTEITDGEAG